MLGADDIENTLSLLLFPLFVFTELLPGNAMIKSGTILNKPPHKSPTHQQIEILKEECTMSKDRLFVTLLSNTYAFEQGIIADPT
jgi:hypothetical protein